MTRLKGLCGLAALLLVTACSGDRGGPAPATYDPIPPMMPAEAPPPVPEGPAVPRIEVRLPAADATLVRGRLATARRARGYAITVDQPAQLVAEKRLPPDEALKRTNGATSNAAFRLDYIFNTSGGAVTVSLEASIVANPGSQGEVVKAIAMPGPDADALKKEIADSV
ncbi:hypothetical protein [Xanthobacter sediminis]